MTRVAAIDCGTNTIRLLVADVEPHLGRTTEVIREGRVTRLGRRVDRTGEFDPQALELTLAATREFAVLIAEHGAERVRFVATSATRDARNREQFVAGVRAALGVDPEVVSGEEEARLSFAGAVSVVADHHPGPYLVVDLGGGSTELVLGESEPEAAISLDIGSVRLHERHLHSDPPTQAEIADAAVDAREALERAAAVVPLGRTATLIGVAGTITTTTAHAMRLPAYDREAIDGAVQPTGIVLAAAQDLLAATRAERVEMPYVHPGRIDVIGAGALIWFEIVSRVFSDVQEVGGALLSVVTSEHDILDGIALSLR
ncbi:exopolyphosphatase [Serinibacter arcticus]|uniref:Exopolyphosphatase n=1 Tax=Serinibacter arcticus TaxID=1655435 RepID=A0A2U1ZYC1_9MICO|nr:exopolyphosphatase [Serinibacter arcticus]PWD51987.1 exopolyphosphatase [Serinibacter arcticus]